MCWLLSDATDICTSAKQLEGLDAKCGAWFDPVRSHIIASHTKGEETHKNGVEIANILGGILARYQKEVRVFESVVEWTWTNLFQGMVDIRENRNGSYLWEVYEIFSVPWAFFAS